jgi:MFS family permease
VSAPSSGAPAPHHAGNGLRAVLARPEFTLLLVGQTASQFGDRLHHMALLALIAAAAAMSTSGIELAKLASAVTLPVILFGPLVGALVDRWDKRRTMIACDLVRAGLVAMIPWLFRQTGYIWPVYVMAFVIALLGLFFNAAKMALIPELVRRDQLLAANAALTSIGRLATVVGIVGGGVLVTWGTWGRIGWTGYEAGFYMDALSYAISVVTLVLIAVRSASSRASEAHFSGAEAAAVVQRELAHFLGDMRRTLGVIRTDLELRFAFATVVMLGVLAAGIFVVMTASVQTVMGLGTREVGYLGGLLAAGMVVGSLFVGTLGKAWDKRQMILVGCLVMGALMLLGAARYSFLVFLPVSFLGGLVLAPVMVAQDTLLHEASPSDARGLIFSTRDLVLGAAFMSAAVLIGTGVPVLGLMGSEQPYRLALFILGVLITAASLGGEAAVLAGRRGRSRNFGNVGP